MRRLTALLALLLLAIVCPAGGARAAGPSEEPRLALVIANGAYRNFDRLGATYADGDKIAAALTTTGFIDAGGAGAVTVRRDLTQAEIAAAIVSFREKLAAAGPRAFGVLYYSGHGVAVRADGDVMMVGTDVSPQSLGGVAAMSRAAVTRDLMQSGAKTVLVILDMCRNAISAPLASAPEAPLAETSVAAGPGSKGLRRVVREASGGIRPDQGYLVAYSTSTGQVAFDDGTFSKVLADEIRRPRQNIADALKRVSDRVAMRPGGNYQKPTFDYGLQGQPPCFVSCDQAEGDRFYDCATCPYMRTIPAGMTTYGSPASESGRSDDEPMQQQRRVARPFAIGVYEVTVAEWTACVRDGACPKRADWAKENPNPLIPATDIGYEDAQAYVRWLSVQSGRTYRVPDDIEWEYASRGGSSSTFPWGDEISPAEANYDQTAQYRGSAKAPYRGYPEAVNAYPPNLFGLYQTQGNAWEWTTGCATSDCRGRIVRGGSFESVPAELRVANRLVVSAGKRRDDVGLRVVRDLDIDEMAGPS